MMESLHNELKSRGPNAKNVSAHVLCPQVVATNVTAGGPGDECEAWRTAASNSSVHKGFQEYGYRASKMAALVFEAAASGQFYLLADMETDVGYVRGAAGDNPDSPHHVALRSTLLTWTMPNGRGRAALPSHPPLFFLFVGFATEAGLCGCFGRCALGQC
jgi:hypothetical protein